MVHLTAISDGGRSKLCEKLTIYLEILVANIPCNSIQYQGCVRILLSLSYMSMNPEGEMNEHVVLQDVIELPRNPENQREIFVRARLHCGSLSNHVIIAYRYMCIGYIFYMNIQIFLGNK